MENTKGSEDIDPCALEKEVFDFEAMQEEFSLIMIGNLTISEFRQQYFFPFLCRDNSECGWLD